jgi:hypothetical protein
VNRFKKSANVAARVERGVKKGIEEIRRKEILEKKVLQNEIRILEHSKESTKEYYTSDDISRLQSEVKQNVKTNEKLKQTSLTLKALEEKDGGNTNPAVLRMRSTIQEMEDGVRTLEVLRARKRMLLATTYSDDEEGKADRLAREKEKIEEEVREGYRSVRVSSKSQKPGVMREKIVFPPELRDISRNILPPRSPPVPGEVDLLRDDDAEDMQQ